VLRQLPGRMRRINHGHHTINTEALGNEEILHQRGDHRRRVGQAGGLDHHAVDRHDPALQALHE